MSGDHRRAVVRPPGRQADVVEHLEVRCARCGQVPVEMGTAVLHVNRHDGFRLLQASCPFCGDVLATRDDAVLATALRNGVPRRQLLPVAGPLHASDVLELREALEAGWPWTTPDTEPDGPLSSTSPP